jgi:tRNA-specific 2-thiouridylase
LEAKEGDVVEVFGDFYKGNINNYIGFIGDEEDKLDKLSQKISYTVSSGRVIGKHQGAHFYTIGQRKGLNIGGHKDPIFVIDTDVESNIIFVGEGQEHPGLYRKALFIKKSEIHWIREDLELSVGEIKDFKLRIRYRQPLQTAKLYMKSEGLYIVFNDPQRGITPGQFAAWYSQDNELIGSGVIY